MYITDYKIYIDYSMLHTNKDIIESDVWSLIPCK